MNKKSLITQKSSTLLFFSLESGYQMKIVFVNMNYDKKENLKVIYKMLVRNSVKA